MFVAAFSHKILNPVMIQIGSSIMQEYQDDSKYYRNKKHYVRKLYVAGFHKYMIYIYIHLSLN